MRIEVTNMIRRERYKNTFLIARSHKVRSRELWHASIAVERLTRGEFREAKIEPGLGIQEFLSEEDAIDAAFEFGRRYVEGFRDPHSNRSVTSFSSLPQGPD
jgi:hypothetical protein